MVLKIIGSVLELATWIGFGMFLDWSWGEVFAVIGFVTTLNLIGYIFFDRRIR